MNLYLDASALVKEYLTDEAGAEEIAAARRRARLVGTTVVSRAETEAALGEAVRMSILTEKEARTAQENFRDDWPDLSRVQVTESIVRRAGVLAFDEGLRGYDAVQFASALAWKEGIAEEVTFATFDVALWATAGRHALTPFPEDLPQLLDAWQQM